MCISLDAFCRWCCCFIHLARIVSIGIWLSFYDHEKGPSPQMNGIGKADAFDLRLMARRKGDFNCFVMYPKTHARSRSLNERIGPIYTGIRVEMHLLPFYLALLNGLLVYWMCACVCVPLINDLKRMKSIGNKQQMQTMHLDDHCLCHINTLMHRQHNWYDICSLCFRFGSA